MARIRILLALYSCRLVLSRRAPWAPVVLPFVSLLVTDKHVFDLIKHLSKLTHWQVSVSLTCFWPNSVQTACHWSEDTNGSDRDKRVHLYDNCFTVQKTMKRSSNIKNLLLKKDSKTNLQAISMEKTYTESRGRRWSNTVNIFLDEWRRRSSFIP